MIEEQEQQKERGNKFQFIGKERKINFQRDQKAIDKLIKKKQSTSVYAINPEIQVRQNRVGEQGQQQSLCKQQNDWESNALPKIEAIHESVQFQELRTQQILNNNAKKFIQRIKKEKQYNKGKFLLVRKRQEQQKVEEKKRLEEIRNDLIQFYNQKRLEKARTNIILHESRVSYRAGVNLKRSMKKSQIRSKTENAIDRNLLEQALSPSKQYLPTISKARIRLSNASYLIDSPTRR